MFGLIYYFYKNKHHGHLNQHTCHSCRSSARTQAKKRNGLGRRELKEITYTDHSGRNGYAILKFPGLCRQVSNYKNKKGLYNRGYVYKYDMDRVIEYDINLEEKYYCNAQNHLYR